MINNSWRKFKAKVGKITNCPRFIKKKNRKKERKTDRRLS